MKYETYTEKRSNDITILCCEWMRNFKKTPRNLSKDVEERKLGTWLNNRKSVKRDLVKGHWFSSDDVIATEYGFPTLFGRQRCRGVDESLRITTDVCEWIVSNNTEPKINSKNALEKRYAGWIACKKSRSNNINGFLYPEELVLVESYNLSHIFTKKMVDKWSIEAELLSKWITDNNRIPLPTDDENIYKIYRKITKRDKLSDVERQIFISANQDWILNIEPKTYHETKSNDSCVNVCEFYLKHNKIPSHKDDELLSSWIRRKKLAIKQIKGGGVIYDSDIAILKKYKLDSIIFPLLNSKSNVSLQ